MFGQNLKLEPLSPEKTAMWRREMACLVSVCDYIVEFFTESQTLQNGTTIEVILLLYSRVFGTVYFVHSEVKIK